MEALELFKIRERMCKQGCKKCPVSYCNNGFQLDCLIFMLSCPEKFVQLVENWAAENPIKTRGDKLKELFPNMVCEDGFPVICPRKFEGCTSEEFGCAGKTCSHCVEEYLSGEYVQN